MAMITDLALYVCVLGGMFINYYATMKLFAAAKKIDVVCSDVQDIVGAVLSENYKIVQQMENNTIKFEQLLLDLRKELNQPKPMKTNNWNSVREAFKGPTRAIDE